MGHARFGMGSARRAYRSGFVESAAETLRGPQHLAGIRAAGGRAAPGRRNPQPGNQRRLRRRRGTLRSEEHTSELQSLMRISYAVFCLKKKNIKNNNSN